MRARRRIPPWRTCGDCGRQWRAWGGVLCPACVRKMERPQESWRAFRKRVIEGQE